MYIDFESWYSAYALVLPSRCAEAVKLSRLGHNRERTGREVHPLSDVVGTQRDIRRHVGCRATEGELRQLPRSSSDESTSARKSPFPTNGEEINWITVPARAATVAIAAYGRNLHGQRTQANRIEANRSEAESQETQRGERRDSSNMDHAAHRLVRPPMASAGGGVLFLPTSSLLP